jgi:hypothetical protein
MENAMATERDDESDSLDEGEAGFARAPARGLLWWGRLDPEETEAAGWAREETRTLEETENDPTAVSVV